MSSLAWYWHRLRAMTPAEWGGHFRRKVFQVSDSVSCPGRFAKLRQVGIGGTFPVLPPACAAPDSLKAALAEEAADLLAGRWLAFGHLLLQVDDPPRWHKDYLSGTDLATRTRAVKLDHRLQSNADNKLLWEPSRWYALVRLAQAAYLLGDRKAASTCRRWLWDWVTQNPPYIGWNWTSALESGLRLVQFVWIDALLGQMAIPAPGPGNAPALPINPPPPTEDPAADPELRAAILLPHFWYTWRDRSFGSSANNHLLGELAGVILALVRWPALADWAASLDTLQPRWEKEVLAQFASDGGNREQALSYHWFSWEFCWQTRLALHAAGHRISPEVEDRLAAAAQFYHAMQVSEHPWEFGDSDGAWVTPFFARSRNSLAEWHQWLNSCLQSESSNSPITYWIGPPPAAVTASAIVNHTPAWRIYSESGLALCQLGDWLLRWDLSPLGYLATASHGHCDALHLSIWFKGRPVVVDPGTGAYYADKPLRDYLASWDAHNGPHPADPGAPRRMGTFLWSAHHGRPRWESLSDTSLRAELALPAGVMRRTITHLDNGWAIDDAFIPATPGAVDIEVLWQLPPGAHCQPSGQNSFRLQLDGAAVQLAVTGWKSVDLQPAPDEAQARQRGDLRGLCSPAFRQITSAPFLRLRSSSDILGLRTSFTKNAEMLKC
jgi:hypothetical protein